MREDLKANKPHTARTNHLSAKCLSFRVHKDLSELNNKGADDPVLKWAKDLNRHSTKEGTQGTSDRKELVIYHQPKADEKPQAPQLHARHYGKETSCAETPVQQKNALSYCWGDDKGARLCERARSDLSPLDYPEIVLKILQQLINPSWKLPFQLASS